MGAIHPLHTSALLLTGLLVTGLLIESSSGATSCTPTLTSYLCARQALAMPPKFDLIIVNGVVVTASDIRWVHTITATLHNLFSVN